MVRVSHICETDEKVPFREGFCTFFPKKLTIVLYQVDFLFQNKDNFKQIKLYQSPTLNVT